MNRAWLLPNVVPVSPGKVRTIGEIDVKTRTAAKNARWRLSPKGRAWLAKNLERSNAYSLRRYHADPNRRAYLRQKLRELRARRAA